MRKHIIFLLSMFSATLACGHTANTNVKLSKAVNDTLPSVPQNTNYVFTRTMLSEDGGKYFDEIQFYDGLGRESERTLSDGNNFLGAIYKHFLQEYDSLGRAEKTWLPATSKQTFLKPKSYKLLINGAYDRNDKRPFAQTIYEPSSTLNRTFRQYSPGDAWADHPKQTEYLANTSSDLLRCSFYYINEYNYLDRQNDYPTGDLNVTKTADEDGKTTYTFIDKQGHTVLIRQLNGSEKADTYSVYDSMGRLRFVLPPMINDNISLSNLELYAYEYKYDSFGRCISKKLPGCSAISYVYDKSDRIILSQDGNQSLKKEWTFTFYDNIGRETLKGLCNLTAKPSLENVIVRAYRTSTENGGVLKSGYEVENFPYALSSLLQANYYDDYYFTSDIQLAYDHNSKYDFQYINATYGSISARGLLTGTKVKILGTDLYLSSAFYYDDKGKIVQSRSQNHKGGYDVEYYSYTFSGKPSAKMCTYQVKNGNQYVEEYGYVYNEVDDIISINHKFGDAINSKKLISYQYDTARRIQFKDVGMNGVITRYIYDIHDQMTESTSPFFSQQLFYHNGTGTPCYNGNISSMTWKSESDANMRGYRFKYDGLNRLVHAEYGEKDDMSLNRGRYDEGITSYDKNGNIRGLQRFGQTDTNAYGQVDGLSLSYTGNRLLCVTDSATKNTYGSGFDFKKGAELATEYFYDTNGNLTKDLNKKITDIQYNCLNLPQTIEFVDGSTVSYLYRADGRKLQVTHKNENSVNVTDYCGNAVYENGSLKKILTEGEGYISLSGSTPVYNYYLKDHMGNIRIVYDQNREVKDVNHYYPFGGLIASSANSNQPYKYNGKELDRKNGLDWYDYGARHYDATLGRWHVIDSSSEKNYSNTPYGYCFNNPVTHIDPDGKQGVAIPTPYGPLPFYYPLANTQSYNLPSDQQIMRHTSNKFAELGQMITDAPKMSYTFGSLLFYQVKSAVSPEYNHQRKRDRRAKEDLDQQQANIANSIDTNVSGMMPNGDPAPKRDPKDGGKKTIIGLGVTGTGYFIDGIWEIFNPKPGQDAVEAHTDVEKERIQNNEPTMWEKIFSNIFKQ